MKTILSSAPLFIAAAAIAALLLAVLLNLSIITPESIGLGAGLATCAGLLAMLARDLEPRSCY